MGMDSAQRRRREGSQRARAARERPAAARARQQQRSLFIGALIAAAAIAVVIAVVVVLAGRSSEVGREVPLLTGLHQPPYVYNTNPPTSGNHLDTIGRYGFWGEDLIPELVVHNMEHGAVVIWYAPGDPELAGSINRLLHDLGPRCLIAGSYQGMEYPVVATVWGRLLELDSYDEARLREFIGAYRGAQGPEAGLCRQEPLSPTGPHTQ